MGKVTVITSGKGGTGKSTVTAGLGAALARRGNRVLIIDCDAGMRGIDLMLGVSGELVFDIADIVGGNCPPASAIYPCKTVPELYVLPAPQNVRDEISPFIMKQLVSVLKKYYDHILIDCPAGIGSGTTADPYEYIPATGTAVDGTTYYKRYSVLGADIRGNVYGGGNNAEVTGNTDVIIGKKKTE